MIRRLKEKNLNGYEEIIDEKEVRITECLLGKVASISADLQYLLNKHKDIFKDNKSENFEIQGNQSLTLLELFDKKANQLADQLYKKYYEVFLGEINLSHIGKYKNLLQGTFLKGLQKTSAVMNLHRILYYFSFYYFVKFYIWSNSVKELFQQRQIDFEGDEDFRRFNDKIDEVFRNVNKDDDGDKYIEETIRFLFLNLYLNDESMKLILNVIMTHAGKFRIKTPESAVSKLLFDEDALTQFINKGVVDDIFGLNINYDSVEELVTDASSFLTRVNGKYVLKSNDRGVLRVDHDNKHTLNTKPFLNMSFALEEGDQRVTFGEMSFRQSFRGELRDVINKTGVIKVNRKTKKKSGKKDGSFIVSDVKKFWEIMLGVNEVNHPLYKLIQSITILNNSLNNGFANYWTAKKIYNYLNSNINDIVLDLIKKLKDFLKKEYKHILNLSMEDSNLIELSGIDEINDSKLLMEICWNYVLSYIDFGKDKQKEIVETIKDSLSLLLNK